MVNSSRSYLLLIILLIVVAILPLLWGTQHVVGTGSNSDVEEQMQQLRMEEGQLKARLQTIEMQQAMLLQQQAEQFEQQQRLAQEQIRARFVQYALILAGIIIGVLVGAFSFNVAARLYRNRSAARDNSWVRLTEAEKKAIIAMRRNRSQMKE